MAVKKAVAPKKVEAPAMAEDQASEAAPKKKKSRLGSLAEVFDETKAGGGIGWPDGDYTARITAFEIEESDKDDSVRVVITYTDAEGEQDKDQKQSYLIADKEGDPGAGISFLKGDLETLGYSDVTFDTLEETLEEIASQEPLVNITVKTKGKWKNAYLQGLADAD